MTWKKPWTVLAWLVSPDRFEPEEPPMDPAWSQFGSGGFWRWLFTGERFEEEPEIRTHRTRFGDQSFWRWLFASEGRPEEDTVDRGERDN